MVARRRWCNLLYLGQTECAPAPTSWLVHSTCFGYWYSAADHGTRSASVLCIFSVLVDTLKYFGVTSAICSVSEYEYGQSLLKELWILVISKLGKIQVVWCSMQKISWWLVCYTLAPEAINSLLSLPEVPLGNSKLLFCSDISQLNLKAFLIRLSY